VRTIAHISDLHFDRIDPRVVEGLAADLAAKEPSLVVMSGDFMMGIGMNRCSEMVNSRKGYCSRGAAQRA